MNRRMVFHILSIMIIIESALMLLPLAVSLIYREKVFYDFLLTIIVSASFGTLIFFISKPKKKLIYAKEGFIIVALSWIAMSLFGALPFYISREIPSYIDAFFEVVSGFTTTGASILENVESLSYGLLFWRSFTHWIGGMGILVFVMAIIPSVADRSIHIMRAEVPGPIVGKLVPTVKQTAKILYLIYVFLTALEIVMLLFGGMSLFDSVVHSFGTAGTGGFGIKALSVGGYNNYCQIVITVFMLLFGINFNIFYLLLIKKFSTALKSAELWCYLAIFAISSAVITLNILPQVNGISDGIRLSTFQVASVMTTTGFSTTDFNTWPTLSKAILFILMFIGACAGSTGGGIKVSRIIIVFKSIKSEIKKLLHPRAVTSYNFEGKKLEETTKASTLIYFVLFFVCFFITFLIICTDGFDFETSISAVAACINNIGPGFGVVGPMGNFSGFSPISKLVLSAAMLLGRLELYPLIIIFFPSAWSRNK